MTPQKIIDNSNVKLATFINGVLKEIPNTQIEIATAYFNIRAFAFIMNNIQDVRCFRLLPGKAPEESPS
ncbi:MAG: hypothetical protein E3K37_02805 [Candidatus Kuenenia sp.]|nr:hypothetical protein [Candidatus Kuenenia hertensis]